MCEALHAGLEVRLIATPREHLKTCRPDEFVADVVRRNTERYTDIPVVDEPPSELIIGLFHMRPIAKMGARTSASGSNCAL